jgi:hypothetical protein
MSGASLVVDGGLRVDGTYWHDQLAYPELRDQRNNVKYVLTATFGTGPFTTR